MIAQIFIAVLGVTAIWLSQDLEPQRQKWASVFGLASQPFWYWAAIEGQQWGILFLSFFYTAAWGRGFYNNWMVEND